MPNNTKWMVLIVVAAVIGAFAGPALYTLVPAGIALLICTLLLVAALGYVIYILAGNKVGRPATPAMVADARAFAPAPGTARLYVVRRGFMGGLAGMKIDIAGREAGQIRMNQFVMAELPPGTYTLATAMARNGLKSSRSSSEVTLAPGEVMIVRAMLEVRATHAMTVQQVLAPAEGRSEIMAARMVTWSNMAPAPASPGAMAAPSAPRA